MACTLRQRDILDSIHFLIQVAVRYHVLSQTPQSGLSIRKKLSVLMQQLQSFLPLLLVVLPLCMLQWLHITPPVYPCPQPPRACFPSLPLLAEANGKPWIAMTSGNTLKGAGRPSMPKGNLRAELIETLYT